MTGTLSARGLCVLVKIPRVRVTVPAEPRVSWLGLLSLVWSTHRSI